MPRLVSSLALLFLCASPLIAQELDPKAWTSAPARVELGPATKVGYRVEIETRGLVPLRTWIAVVGETKSAWKIETNQHGRLGGALLPGMSGKALALEVDKATGRVLKARLGAPGGALVEIPIEPLPSQNGPTQPTRSEAYPLPDGSTVQAEVRVTPQWTSWRASEGPLKGKLLRVDHPTRGYRLEALDTVERKVRGLDAPLKVTRLTYSKGIVQELSDDPVIRALAGGVARSALKIERLSTETRVAAVASDARATLSW